MQSRIEDYGLIGNGYSAALVSRSGCIDWLCWPRFDSDACFATLLGTEANGYWKIHTTDANAQVTRKYQDDTLILETTFETAEGIICVIDFMPWKDDFPELVRLVRGISGSVSMHMEFVLRFGYGYSVPWVTRLSDGSGIKAVVGPDMVILRTTAELQNVAMKTTADFTVSEGEEVYFSLQYGRAYDSVPLAYDAKIALAATAEGWREWSSKSKAHGKYRDAIHRSLITLKAMAYQPSGGLVAAVTTSLPESIGGDRNWDYRFCWLRDATLTLRTLMRGGYYEEAKSWRDWLIRAIAGAPGQLQIMYSITGERRLQEWECDWLKGYENSKPVRIGNAAAYQMQLDVFGEVMNALYEARLGGLAADRDAWSVQVALVNHVADIWKTPDEGIWETRGGRRNFTFSKVMCWVAVDRGIKCIEEFSLDGPLDKWRILRDEIHADVCRHGFSEERNSFVQTYDGDQLDASLLQLAIVGFLPPEDPRIRGTVDAIEHELNIDGFVLRYKTETMHDGLQQGEGSFLACSFWLVENISLQGRHEEAIALFDKLLAIRNDLGLLAEEYDTQHQRLVGNFPQAFSHLTLVETAFNLLERTSDSKSSD
ncbi:MAG: glycoside hydrolase family 15 protein [Gammaproteobacteria bacterium]|nr:MAG: glycoside hydrolase family 15 protein [Gammaproteobacteria bacterium]